MIVLYIQDLELILVVKLACISCSLELSVRGAEIMIETIIRLKNQKVALASSATESNKRCQGHPGGQKCLKSLTVLMTWFPGATITMDATGQYICRSLGRVFR